ncbi:mannose-6-phosphate isomerase [Phlebopus sp. FC_14]|nr:mannose-6-phosphate isomerase [Phlebopus sp. FC_14]
MATAMTAIQPVFRVAPTIQNYDWGKVGKHSKVAQFASNAHIPGFNLDDSACYAEATYPSFQLWMGTHVKSPSGVVGSPDTLPQTLAANPRLIGDRVSSEFDTTGGNLPFLFKVLSIGKALSIQVHPDKATAAKLHADPNNVYYKDPNHKPEMALALTPFQSLCGFMPISSVATYLKIVPEFSNLVPTARKGFEEAAPSENEELKKDALKKLFAELMNANVAQVKDKLSQLVSRYQKAVVDAEQKVKDLVLTLNEQYPGDIGVFCAFMLNHVILEPGEAIFLGAGEPHAYISGDIMECMANSDNVIRAGLTPKPRDIERLLDCLTYKAGPWSNHQIKWTPFCSSDITHSYDPPIPEFTVLEVKLQRAGTETHDAINGPSIAIATGGSGCVKWAEKSLDLEEGNVVFIGAGANIAFHTSSGLTVYRAYVE